MEKHGQRRKNESKKKKKKMENEARKRQENCTDPHGFLRATRETVVDKRREYPAVINYETFATVGNSYKKNVLSRIYSLSCQLSVHIPEQCVRKIDGYFES